MEKYLSSQNLEKHVRDSYAKIEKYAKEDGVYEPLSAFFANGTPNGRPGRFCYSDVEGYHLGSIDIRGNIRNIVTQSLSDITYQVLKNDIFWMSVEYERKNRIDGQDNRRIMFDKILQYWSIIGEELAERERERINKALEENPFED